MGEREGLLVSVATSLFDWNDRLEQAKTNLEQTIPGLEQAVTDQTRARLTVAGPNR